MYATAKGITIGNRRSCLLFLVCFSYCLPFCALSTPLFSLFVVSRCSHRPITNRIHGQASLPYDKVLQLLESASTRRDIALGLNGRNRKPDILGRSNRRNSDSITKNLPTLMMTLPTTMIVKTLTNPFPVKFTRRHVHGTKISKTFENRRVKLATRAKDETSVRPSYVYSPF